MVRRLEENTMATINDNLELMTIRELAALLRITPRHVRNLVADGKLPPPIKLGASVRWPRAAVASWLAAQTAETAKMSE